MKPMIQLAVAALCALPVTAYGNDLDIQVQRLLREVADSGCIFIRNGREHDPERSVAHISHKYDHFRDEIDSIETFVELTATKSLVTGQAYQVRCDDEVPVSSADWLLARAGALGLIR